MKDYIRLLRPKHFIKNLLVMIPLIFSGKLTETKALVVGLLGVLAFCLLSSAVYIINDIADAKQDRAHPARRNRPVASGRVSAKGAAVEFSLLIVLLIVLGVLCRFSIYAWLCLAGYLLLNILYSLGLKNIPILDVAILASGFVLRVVFGSAISGIHISGWLYLVVISVSFYMGLGKRRGEITQLGGETRAVLRYYNYGFLDKSMQMFLTLSIVFYSLWSISGSGGSLVSSSRMFWTVPLVICICLKYSLNVEGASDGDPVEVLYKDKILMLMVLAFVLLTLGLIYF